MGFLDKLLGNTGNRSTNVGNNNISVNGDYSGRNTQRIYSTDTETIIEVNGRRVVIPGTSHSISVKNRKIYVDGQEIKDNGESVDLGKGDVTVQVYGNVNDLNATHATVNGDVTRDVNATNVTCKNVGNTVTTTHLNCTNITGNVTATHVKAEGFIKGIVNAVHVKANQIIK